MKASDWKPQKWNCRSLSADSSDVLGSFEIMQYVFLNISRLIVFKYI